MQDYAKMYPRKYQEPDAEEIVRRIKLVLRSNFTQAMMLTLIIGLIESKR